MALSGADANGNIKASYSPSVTLSIKNNAGSSTLSGTTTVTPTSGTSTFSGLSLNKVGTGYTLTATDGTLTSADSSTFNVSANSAASLAFSIQPVNTAISTNISPAPQVTALDSSGNTVTGYSGNITIAIGINAGGGTLSGTIPVAAVSGVSTFSDLKINAAGAGYTLSATASGLSTATSSTFNIIGIPGIPSTPTATAGITTVALSWTASTGLGSITYAIKRATASGGPYTTIGNTSGTTFTDTTGNGISAGTQYYYVVSASNVAGSSSNSSEVTATPLGSFNLTSATAGGGQVTVAWGTATGATGYTLTYGTATGTYPVVWSTSATSPTTVTGLTNGQTYYFRVKATNATGSGLSTGELSASPVGPGNFQIITAEPGNASVTLSWTSSSNATSYSVKYGTATGVYGTTASNSATSPYKVTGLVGGTLYYFMVTATTGGTTINADSERSASPGTAWVIYGDVANSSLGPYYRFQSALDSSNNFYLGSYYPYGTPYQPFVMKYGAANWSYVGGSRLGSSTAQFPSMAIAPAGPSNANNIYIAYQDGGGSTANALSVRAWDGSSWSILGGTLGFTAQMDYSSIKADASGNIWVAYRRTSDSNLMVTEYTSGAWTTPVNVSGVAAERTFNIAFDTSTTPYTPYLVWHNSTYQLNLAKYSSGSWASVSANAFTTNQYAPATLEISGGVPYVAYGESSNDRVSVKKYSSGSWSYVGTSGFSPGTVGTPQIAFDTSNSTPYVAYTDNSIQGRVTVQKYSSGAWSVVGKTGFSDVSSYSGNWNVYQDILSFVIDSNSNLYVTLGFSKTGGYALTYTFNSAKDYGAQGLGWSGTFPSASTSLTASWTPSTNASISNQYIQFYQDEYCGNNSGSVVDLASTVTSTRAFTGVAGITYSYRVKTTYSNQDPIWSNCSSAMAVRSAFVGLSSGQPVGLGSLSASVQPRVVLDKVNNAYVGFMESNAGTSRSGLSVQAYRNGSWNYLGSNGQGICASCYGISSIDLDSNGVPWVVGTNTNAYVYTYSFANGTWSAVGAASLTAAVAGGISLRNNPNTNYPYLAFVESSKPSVMSWNGTTWSYLGSSKFTTNNIATGGGQYEMAVDSAGVPYVAFVDATYNQLFVMKYSSGAWSYVGTTSSSGITTGATQPYGLSIAIDPTTNYPVVAYLDPAVSQKVSVKRFDGTSWTLIGSAGFTTNNGYNGAGIKIGIDTVGTIWMSDTVNNRIWKYTSSWATVPFTLYTGFNFMYFAFDSSNNPWISYYDNGKNSSVFVKQWVP